MNKLKLPLFSLCFLLIFGLLFPTLAEANTAPAATLTEVKGDVIVKKGAGKKEIRALEGMTLAQGDRVRTGESGSATIDLKNQDEIVLGEMSQIIFSGLSGKNIAIKLLSGMLWNKVESEKDTKDRYVIETSISTISVDGTLFLVNVGNENDFPHVSVLDGTVNVKGLRTADEVDIEIYEQVHSIDLKQEELDLSIVVKETDRIILIQMILDGLEVAKEREQKGEGYLEQYEENGSQYDILHALVEINAASLLAQMTENMVLEIERNRHEEIEQTIMELGLNWQEIKERVTEAVQSTEEIRMKTNEAAERANLDIEQQEEMIRKLKESQDRLDESRPSPTRPVSGGGSGGGGGTTPSPPVDELAHVWLDENDEGTKVTLNVKGFLTNKPIVALQAHFGFEGDEPFDELEMMDIPIESTFFSSLEAVNDQKGINHHERAELIFAQTLFGPPLTSGYQVTGNETIALEITNDGLATQRPFSVNILDLIIIDVDGNPIELEFEQEPIMIEHPPW